MSKILYYSELLKMLKKIALNPKNHVRTDIYNNPNSNFWDVNDSVGVVQDKNDKIIFEAPKKHDGKIIINKRDKKGMFVVEDEAIPKEISKRLHDIIMKRIKQESELDRGLDLAQTKTLKYLEQFADHGK